MTKKLTGKVALVTGGSRGIGVDDPSNEVSKFDRQFAVNVGGVAAAVRSAAKFIGDGGRIISVGSVLGSHVPFPGLADYSAIKAAVAGYTKGWARDFGPKGGPEASHITDC
jgi:3-oxoacyl-[acyl-carrier protein] reductase